jgi:hypothetical protein
MHFLALLEQSALSTWIRESPSMFVFPGFLVVHAIGMAFLAGTNAAVDLRILGFAPRVPLSLMDRFFPVMWFGFVINAISGILLLIAYPTKGLTNPLFYLKLGCIAAGVVLAVKIRRKIVRNPIMDNGGVRGRQKLIALASLALWAVAIFSGRLLAYTCIYLLADSKC